MINVITEYKNKNINDKYKYGAYKPVFGAFAKMLYG
jgi:hypothetical protein